MRAWLPVAFVVACLAGVAACGADDSPTGSTIPTQGTVDTGARTAAEEAQKREAARREAAKREAAKRAAARAERRKARRARAARLRRERRARARRAAARRAAERREREAVRQREEEEAASQCHPNYEPCLDPNASDYDCQGGEGDGPEYTGPVTVKGGSDPYDLDRDGDGTGCDT